MIEFHNKRIAVTGGVGSVGSEIVRQLLGMAPRLIRVIDNNEGGLFDLQMRLADCAVPVDLYHADVADEDEMARALSGIDICFHAAALKHVPACERSPFSAIKTNVGGVQAVIKSALANGLERVLFTSSDKAVNPTNVMGTSKLLGERLFTAAHALAQETSAKTVFSSTRFGNVACSRGSVIPVFADQIARGGPVTLTDPRMTRFLMSIDEAVRLVIESATIARGGEVFVTKMPVVRITDLAQVMIERLAPDPASIEIVEIGPRPGEKLWEELSTHEESRRLIEGDRYMSVLPALSAGEANDGYPGHPMQPSDRVYHSDREQPLTRDELAAFLDRIGVGTAA